MSTPSLPVSKTAPNLRPSRRQASGESSERLDLRAVLLHPAWLGGLALLAVNDHLLKGAGLLPTALTGKLSDFAGLFVAPALFAFVLRVKDRHALLACHLVVGLVFAALQLSPGFAALWSQAFAAMGPGWTTTMDPSDLMALVSLVLSYRMWTTVAARAHASQSTWAASLARPWRRAAVLGSAASGLALSVATSPPTDIGEFYSDFSAQTFVNNAGDNQLAVLLRPLRPEVQVDCDEVALDPGGLLPESAFASAERWDLPARTSINVWTDGSQRECYAVWISGDSFPPFVMFWQDTLPQRLIPGQSASESDLLGAGVAIVSDSKGVVTQVRDTSVELAFVPGAADTQVGEGCELAEAGARIDWVGIDAGQYDISGVDLGVDGCLRLSLASTLTGAESMGYICMPSEAFPFSSGDRVAITRDTDELTIHDPGLDLSETRWLNLLRGAGESQLESPFFSMATRELQGCGFDVDLDCATTQRRSDLLVVGSLDSAAISVGEAPTILNLSDGRVAEFHLAHASSRAVLDSECASGADLLGADVDLVTYIH